MEMTETGTQACLRGPRLTEFMRLPGPCSSVEYIGACTGREFRLMILNLISLTKSLEASHRLSGRIKNEGNFALETQTAPALPVCSQSQPIQDKQ